MVLDVQAYNREFAHPVRNMPTTKVVTRPDIVDIYVYQEQQVVLSLATRWWTGYVRYSFGQLWHEMQNSDTPTHLSKRIRRCIRAHEQSI